MPSSRIIERPIGRRVQRPYSLREKDRTPSGAEFALLGFWICFMIRATKLVKEFKNSLYGQYRVFFVFVNNFNWCLMDKIKDRLIKSRKSAGYTQLIMSKKLGFSQNSIIDWEKGRVEPKSSTLKKWADITKCDPTWLFTGNIDKNPKNVTGALSDSRNSAYNAGIQKIPPEDIMPSHADIAIRALEKNIGFLEKENEELKGRLVEKETAGKQKKNQANE